MLISIGAPNGVAPRQEPHNLPDGWAVKAVNCKFWNGSLRPYRAPAYVTDLPVQGRKRTIYRFGRGRAETEFWMQFTYPASVVRSPIASMNDERTYWSGAPGGLRVTDASKVAASGSTGLYPQVSDPVGVVAPEWRPTAEVTGAPTANATATDRYYVWTLVNLRGEEGPPSPVSWAVSAANGQTIILDDLILPTTIPGGVSAKRIYSTQGSGAAAGFYFVTEVDGASPTATFSASILDATGGATEGAIAVGEPLKSASWLPPPTDIHSLRILPSGVLVGLSDMTIVFSEVGYPYAWPPEYSLNFEHTPIACGVFDQSTVVLTDAYPYIVQGVIPGQMTVRRLETNQACVSARSVVEANGGVAYAAPDGFAFVSSGGVRLITEAFFDRDQWQALDPASMFAVWWDRRFVIFLGNRKGCILLEVDGPPVFCDVWADAAWVDPESDHLYLAQQNDLVRFDSGSEDLEFVWQSKTYLTSGPANFSAALFMGAGVDATLTVHSDGVARGVIPIREREPMRLPAGFLGYAHSFEIRGKGTIYQMKFGQLMKELRG